MTEQELLIDCLRRLNRSELPYLLTGSMASNYWGVPRTTHDVDFVIQLAPTAIPRFLAAFQDDFFIDERSIRGAFQPPYQFNAIDTRSAFKVDFWLLKPVPFEREMFSRRIRVTLFDELAWIATAEDIILHKLHWHKITPSDRQIGDAAGVVSLQREHLNKEYLRQWARELDVSDVLDRLLAGTIRPKST